MDILSFKPRVLVINSARKWIGEAAHTIMLVEGLRSRGIPVVLVCRQGYAMEDVAEKYNIPCYAIRMKGNFNGIDDLHDLLALRSIIKKHNIDIIHAHRGKDHWLSACVRLLPVFRIERPFLIRTRHVTVPVKKHIFNRWLYRKGTDGVIAVSCAATRSLDGLPLRTPPVVIYSAVDTARFSPGKRSIEMRRELGISDVAPDAPLVGIVGRIQRVKGQAVFIDAVKRVLEFVPDARFIVAGTGTGELRDSLQRRAENLNVAHRIRFLGFMEDIERLIASLDIGVVASVGSEGSSRIIMEYMASGVPVVATCVGGIPEIIENGHLGWLVEPDNCEKLARGVIEALLNRHASQEKAALALEKARAHLSIQRFINETLCLYQKVMWKTGQQM